MVDQHLAGIEPVTRLEAFFTEIWQTRMAGLPILNPALRVEAVNFLPWDNGWLGVMVTPWFMSLLWVPSDQEATLGKIGDKVMQYLPAGDYEFVVAHEEGIGDYLSCSLCSPMSPFADQESARATAVAVMETVLQVADGAAADSAPSQQADTPRSRRPLSRRDLLFGRFLGGKFY
jgi:[NiFe] hydrogenase assembly HybE family chaperone